MDNLNVGLILHNIGQVLKIKGANRYKIDAYEQASKKISQLAGNINKVADEEGLTSLEGIGSGLAEKIEEILTTGQCSYYEQLADEYPISLLPLLKLRGVGAGKVRKFHDELGITNLEELKAKAEAGELTQLTGIGNKTEQKILSSIAQAQQVLGKLNLAEGEKWANSLCEYLLAADDIIKVEAAGELRRQEELITELVFVVAANNKEVVEQHLAELPIISAIGEVGNRKIAAETELGIDFIFHLSTPKRFATDLFWLTGTEEFNQKLEKDFPDLNSSDEEGEIFRSLKLDYIIPELRDNEQIIQAAKTGDLPESVTQDDIKGDLHMHSNWSDGRVSIREMASACWKQGYEYLAITDHTQALAVANGLDYEELKAQREEINQLNEELEIELLTGTEVDILQEELDYGNSILEELDIVIASIHSGFDDSKEKIMSRLFLALENPYVDILGHPTGRLLAARKGYQLNFSQVVDKAAATGTILEINASPKRLDLDGYRIREAQQAGVEFVINTDAHHPTQLANISYGAAMARKGGLEPEQVVNTYSLAGLKNKLANHK